MLSAKNQRTLNLLYRKHFKGCHLDHGTQERVIEGPREILSKTGDEFLAEEMLLRNREIYDRTGFKAVRTKRYQIEKLKKGVFAVVDFHNDNSVVDIFLTDQEARRDAKIRNLEKLE